MFSVLERDQLRRDLVNAAGIDPRVVGAALTGSTALGEEDRWSDIDFALSVDREMDAVVTDWTALMYACDAVGHVDVRRGSVLFRVFLMRSSLQVDVAFWPSSEFGATGPAFQLLFGEANPLPRTPQPDRAELVGLAWLHGLHVRSSLARGRVWQALHLLNGMRDHMMSLRCLAEGVAAVQGRGLDDLADPDAFAGTVAVSTRPEELGRAFHVVVGLLLREVTDSGVAQAVRALSPVVAPPE